MQPDEASVTPGALLVASPLLRDPNFARTVVFVIDHRDDGTTGVVLNRPSEVPVHSVLPQWGGLMRGSSLVFVGGPVSRDSALAIAQVTPGAEPGGWRPVIGTIGLADLDSDPVLLDAELTDLRVFAGYAGWDAGQLADEIAEGAWIVAPGMAGDVFWTPADRDLWSAVLRRTGGQAALLSTYPDDPRLN